MIPKIRQNFWSVVRHVLYTLVFGTMLGQSTVAYSTSQRLLDTSLSIHITDGTLEEIFEIIERGTGYAFSYTDDVIAKKGRHTLNYDSIELTNLLYILAERARIKFIRVNKNISVKEAPPAKARERVVRIEREIAGKVVDETGEPLYGATVKVKGTNMGAVADMNGAFRFTVPEESDSLVITFIGYIDAVEPIDDREFYDIKMREHVAMLSDIVVVGYGSQQSYRVSSAVQQVKSEDLDIDKRPVSTIESGLVGSVPGLILSQESGTLGSDVDIQVRSIGSLNNNAALILVDGIETSIENINPNDIASVSVLKDASATSIYGTKGANGVVLFTTKEGTKGEGVSVTLNSNFSWQSPGNTADMLNSFQFMEAFNAARFNDNPNASPLFTEQDLSRAQNGFYPETNWLQELYNETAFQTSQNLSISGGSENTSYFIGIGYLNQDGISQGSDNLERISVRLKTDSKINDWLSIGTNIFNANRTLFTIPISTNNGLRGQPFFPVRVQDGEFAGAYAFKGSTSNEENPIDAVNSGSFNRRITDELNLQLYARIYPLEGLTIEGRVSYIKNNIARTNWDNPYTYVILNNDDLQPSGPPVPFSTEDRQLAEARSDNRRINTWLLATYNKTFHDAHNFDFMLGYQAESGEGSSISASRNGFILDNLQNLGLGTSLPLNTPFGNDSGFNLDRSVVSYFGRIAYDYQGKYLAEFSSRADASSNFVNDRWAFSPALSLGWNMGDELFMQSIPGLEMLKLRASWGYNVDDNIQVAGSNLVANREVVFFNPSGIGFGTGVQPTILLANAINPNLTWETSEKLNFGVDLAMWKGKLTFTGDYFIDNRRDMIAAVQTSIEGGITTISDDGEVSGGILDNVYDARSQGWEISLGYKDQMGQVDFMAGLNLSQYSSELTEGPTQIINDERILRTGSPILGSLYGYETAGYFNTEEDLNNWRNANGDLIDQSAVVTRGDDGPYVGGYRFVDQNNDGVINLDDRTVILDDPVDNFRIGANIGFQYKGFSLSARIYGVLEGTEWLNNASNVNAFASSGVAPFRYQADTWTAENTSSLFARSFVNTRPYDAEVSGLIVQRDYIRLKNINLAYSFSGKLLESLKVVKALDVYLSIENLGVLWTNYPLHEFGFDPEFGSDGFNHPQSLKTSIGLNVKF